MIRGNQFIKNVIKKVLNGYSAIDSMYIEVQSFGYKYVALYL